MRLLGVPVVKRFVLDSEMGESFVQLADGRLALTGRTLIVGRRGEFMRYMRSQGEGRRSTRWLGRVLEALEGAQRDPELDPTTIYTEASV